MCAVGLIVEYNPFHNGHLHHLTESKKITEEQHVVAVMSGHFLQRGEPALLDKWTRTKLALQGGCDLVLELPVVYATSSAEWFAYGAVATLEATGIVNQLCFGTESGLLAPLQQAAHYLACEPLTFSNTLSQLLKEGLAYPVAFSRAVTDMVKIDEQFRFDLPNHTLGLHYLIALQRLHSSITPHTIAREQAQYRDTSLDHTSIASATALRKALLQTKNVDDIYSFVPKSTYDTLKELDVNSFMSWEDMLQPLLYQLLVQPTEKLKQYREINEGLEYRIKSVIPSLAEHSFNHLVDLIKTKRYTRTKLQRALLAILLQHEKNQLQSEQLKQGINYIRVLGFSEKGRQLLKQMKKTATVPVIHSPAQLDVLPNYLQMDLAATSIYRLAQGYRGKQLMDDYHIPPVQI